MISYTAYINKGPPPAIWLPLLIQSATRDKLASHGECFTIPDAPKHRRPPGVRYGSPCISPESVRSRGGWIYMYCFAENRRSWSAGPTRSLYEIESQPERLVVYPQRRLPCYLRQIEGQRRQVRGRSVHVHVLLPLHSLQASGRRSKSRG